MVNLIGQAYGAMAALPRLRPTGGGAPIMIGGGGMAFTMLRRRLPGTCERVLKLIGFSGQRTDRPKNALAPDNLDAPIATTEGERGGFPGRSWSVATWAQLHPAAARTAIVGLLGAVALAARAPRDALSATADWEVLAASCHLPPWPVLCTQPTRDERGATRLCLAPRTTGRHAPRLVSFRPETRCTRPLPAVTDKRARVTPPPA